MQGFFENKSIFFALEGDQWEKQAKEVGTGRGGRRNGGKNKNSQKRSMELFKQI